MYTLNTHIPVSGVCVWGGADGETEMERRRQTETETGMLKYCIQYKQNKIKLGLYKLQSHQCYLQFGKDAVL